MSISLLIGGGMANTFLKARGLEVGKSLLEADLVETARDLLSRGGKIVLPSDVVVTTDLKSPTRHAHRQRRSRSALTTSSSTSGPDAARAFATEIASAGTVLWNGPMGVFEDPRFADGTLEVAHAMADSPGDDHRRRRRVRPGGRASRPGRQADATSRPGGGASLEFIEGKILPGSPRCKADCQ